MTKNYNFSRYHAMNNGEEVEIYSTITKKILNPKTNKNGYRQVTVINDENQPITMNYARFVMIKTDPQEDYTDLVVDHINRIKTDDRPCNLRWITTRENTKNRVTTKRPHRNKPIILEFDNGKKQVYTHINKDLFDIPYDTVYALANKKEGCNYSKKWGVKAYYKY